MKTAKIIKRRCFYLASEIEHADQIKSDIAKFTGVESVDSGNKQLTVAYDLAKCQYSKLKPFIAGLVPLKPDSTFNNLLSSFIRFTEKNELDHLQTPSGWAYHVQDLYLSLHKDNQHY